jgi:hypothetical protein
LNDTERLNAMSAAMGALAQPDAGQRLADQVRELAGEAQPPVWRTRMVGLNVVFWILVILFALIGMTRGWAKELLVTFSVILALFIIAVLEQFAPSSRLPAGTSNEHDPDSGLRIGILLALVLSWLPDTEYSQAGRNRAISPATACKIHCWASCWAASMATWYGERSGFTCTMLVIPSRTIFFTSSLQDRAVEASITAFEDITATWLGVPIIYLQ